MSKALRYNFRKSSYSGPRTENCVEVADLPGASAVRDSQRPEAGHIEFPSAQWAAFVVAVKQDAFSA
ncbi:DUF397 domain-containing protein [Streptomonospora sp. S1-112]|uniref:DUF397 domain-containing protein n=1 Tax=Streptomonospora mangrovi TaxID=2883123 RepID=A0A9X3NNP4_9ACTN|nr:DUF397 domain-containing protein [Streptomonospora mangrovi]MDA0566648.1 DUF397 domain-containing protein [Streptomonospora mangrovi]